MTENTEKPDSPDPKIDEALDFLHSKMDKQPVDVLIKYVNTRINWQKVLHNMRDNGDPFNEDDL